MRVWLGSAVVLAVLSGCATDPEPAVIVAPSPVISASISASPTASPSLPVVPRPPQPGDMLVEGSGSFGAAASGGTGVFGTAGILKKYCVQVEGGITTFTPDDVAPVVDAALADSRSWIAGKLHMFQRVGSCEAADLRIRLATPNTVDRLCYPAADTRGQYSCRNGNNVFINLRRWAYGVSHFPSLDGYRAMVVNHEVGHYLGHGHVNCPGAGRLAPVMQRQSASLDGCVLNPYPYPDGANYVG